MENNDSSVEQNVAAPQSVEEVKNEPLKAKRPKQLQTETEPVAKVSMDEVNANKIPSPSDAPTKVDLTQEDEEQETETGTGGDGVAEAGEAENPVQPEGEVQEAEAPVLEEITDEEVQEQAEDLTDQVEEAVAESIEKGVELPENIQKVVDFMEDTGGSLEDYVKLNQDFSGVDDKSLLKEYYKNTKSHLSNDEIDFLIEDEYDYDEDIDDEKTIRKKKIALKEQVASAKSHLDGQKSKYYEEIKAGSKLTQDQSKAVEFFDRYKTESEKTQKITDSQVSTFQKKTAKVFGNDFKGFDYQVGEKKFRFNVKDSAKVKDTQSDINNFVKTFLNKDNEMSDAKGYHKGLFTAMNSDAIANHFYEQGKADAIKDSVAKAKNVSMDPRQQHGNVIESHGLKVKAVTGDNSSRLRVKMRNK
tara:strand:+ start:1141 stop:2388 length:1248 start_codon:yes stop_codon:yes gene_type:complete